MIPAKNLDEPLDAYVHRVLLEGAQADNIVRLPRPPKFIQPKGPAQPVGHYLRPRSFALAMRKLNRWASAERNPKRKRPMTPKLIQRIVARKTARMRARAGLV